MSTEMHYLKNELYNKIKEEQNIFVFLQESVLDGMWYWDLEKPENEWMSPDFWTTLGFDPKGKKHLASEWQDLIHPEDLKLAIENFKKHCEDPNHPYDQVVRYRHKNGSTVWVRCRGMAIRDKTGKPIRMLGAHTDLTSLKKTEEELRKNERQMTSIFRAAPIGIGVVSNRIIEEVNQRFCEISGYSRDELLGQNARMVYASDEAYEYVGKEKYRMINKKGTGTVETTFRRKDGEIINVLINSTPIDPTNLSIGVTFTALDITETKKAEDALKKNERKFRLLADHTYDWEYWIDPEKNYVYLSPSCERITGYSPEEFIADPELLYKIVHPDYAEKVCRHYKDENNPELSIHSMEFPIIAKNGKEAWLEHNCTPVYDDQGNYAGRRGNNRDITNRKQMERILISTKDQYQRLIEQSPGISYHFSTESGGMFCSSAIKNILGYSPDELMENPFLWSNSIHPDDMNAVNEAIQKAFLNETFDLTYRIQDKGGDWHWFHDRSTGIIIKEGSIVIEGLAMDITDRKLAQEALIQSEHKYRNLFEFIPQPALLTEINSGKIKDINKALCKLTGYAIEELSGRTTTEIGFYSQDERNKFLEKLQTAGEIHAIELDIRIKNGSILKMLAFSKLIEIDQEKLMLSIFVDITEKRQLEEQYRQSQKMESVGRLAGGVAHDFNNALSVIMGFTEMALTDLDPKEPLHEDLNEIFAAARRAADITRQLLAFARKQTIAPIVLDFNNTIESMLKMIRRLIGEDIDLAWLPGAKLWPVNMDPSQINQILANLCVNARDAIEGVGKITIESKNVTFTEEYCTDHPGFFPGEFVQLSVSDSGCGMDKTILENIFEPFFTTKDVDKGTGLGLSTVYGIIKQNKGFINVYSEQDKGTIIKIYLPRHGAKADEICEESTEQIPSGQGETILVVEDDPSILKLMKNILERLDYKVLTSTTPEKVLDMVKEHTGEIHLLITDVIMPKMNGRDLAEQLQSICPNLRCIFMSGYTADVITHRGVLDKRENFIQKPFSRIELAEAVRKTLGENRN